MSEEELRKQIFEEAAKIAESYKYKYQDHEDNTCKKCDGFCYSCELCDCCSIDYAFVIAKELRRMGSM